MSRSINRVNCKSPPLLPSVLKLAANTRIAALKSVGRVLNGALRTDAEDVSSKEAATTSAQSVEDVMSPSSPRGLFLARLRRGGEDVPEGPAVEFVFDLEVEAVVTLDLAVGAFRLGGIGRMGKLQGVYRRIRVPRRLSPR